MRAMKYQENEPGYGPNIPVHLHRFRVFYRFPALLPIWRFREILPFEIGAS
jgi:hypothetical protein